MKKNLFYLFAFICVVSMFTACSDDDDNGWQELPKGDIKAENVDLTLNGAATTGTVSFTATGNNTAEVGLKNVIDGFSDLTVDVTMEKQADGSFKFNGTKDIATKPVTRTANTPAPFLKVAVAGTIDAEGKAVMTLSATGPGLYIGTYSDETLVLTYGDAPVVGKTVRLDASTGEDASILLMDVIPGETETTLTGISFSDAGFSGSAQTSSKATVEYSGSRKDKVLTLNLKVTMPGQWKGTYKLGNVEWGDIDVWKATLTSVNVIKSNSIAKSALYIDTDVRVPEYSAEKYPGKTDYIKYVSPISSLVNIIPPTARSLGGAMLCQVLQSVTLDVDGNIIANYSPEPTKFDMNWSVSYITLEIEKELVSGRNWQASPKNLAYWFEKDGQLYIKLNVPAIVAQAMQDNGSTDLGSLGYVIDAVLNGENAVSIINGFIKKMIGAELKTETLTTLLGWVKYGVPVSVSTADGHTYFYLDKKTLEPIIAELPTFIPIVEESNPMGQGQMISGLLKSFVLGWEYVDKFNIGLDFKNN